VLNIIYTDNRSGKINEDPRSGWKINEDPRSGWTQNEGTGTEYDDAGGFTMVTRKGNKGKGHKKKDAGIMNKEKRNKSGKQRSEMTSKEIS
jgi:hypothetical protein